MSGADGPVARPVSALLHLASEKETNDMYKINEFKLAVASAADYERRGAGEAY